MKKLAILTSLLTLTACGGGSGGGSSIVSGDVINDNNNTNPTVIKINEGMRVSSEAIDSNSNVTSMASEILIAKDGVSPNIVRSATATVDNVVYDSYHLDDVRFFTGPVNGEMREDMYVTFGINDDTGEINRIVYHEGDGLFEVARKDDTNIFIENVYKYKMGSGNSMYVSDSYDLKPNDKNKVRADIERYFQGQEEYIKNYYLDMFDKLGDNWNDEEHWVQETHETSYDLKGKDLNTKLRYSDFGYDTTISVGEDEEPDHSVLAGGYDIKKIDVSDQKFINKTFNLSGTAIGTKSYSDDTHYVSEKIDTNKGAATLSFEKGQETLIMPFNGYYTVTVNKNGDNSNIEFSDYKGSDDNFRFTKETGITTGSTDHAFVSIKYFGDNNNPSEAVGTVHYEEHSETHPGFSGAFGVTK